MAAFVRLLSFNSSLLSPSSLNSLQQNQLLSKNNSKRELSVAAADSCLSSDFIINSRFGITPESNHPNSSHLEFLVHSTCITIVTTILSNPTCVAWGVDDHMYPDNLCER